MFGFGCCCGDSDGELHRPLIEEEEEPFSLSSPPPQLPQAVIPIPNTSIESSSSYFSSDPGSSSRLYRYDVFLSFRGEDTRMHFVDHLNMALENRLILTFKDDKRLDPGEPIGPSLFTAIKESQIALIVFSKKYADSSWCLQELEYIMKCKEERGIIVMPIFYDVEPTDVRKQKNKFGEAFAKYKNEDTNKVASWKKALADACNNVAFDSKNRHEAEFVKEIVDKVFRKLYPSDSEDDQNLVGIPTRLQDLISKLDLGSDRVLRVGIWGLGGGGKTTLANSFYTKMSRLFHGSCIVEDIGEEVSKNYLKELQNKILSDIFNTEVKVKSVIEGKNMMKRMLGGRKVLVVLDDVHDREQLEALAGSFDWFGKGSRIIITTRDENLLDKVEVVCPLRLLSHKEAVELFNKHAYNEKNPIKDYEKISLPVVSYCAGLPLALKVLGSFLYDKDEEEWMSAFHRLKVIPEKKIVEKLEISYDGLTTNEQQLFLDIACYFRARYRKGFSYAPLDEEVMILDACGFHPKIGIKVLRQKALINIGAQGRFEMHDLVQEMAYYIVRRDHPNNPEYHSRLWKKNEIMNLHLWDATEKNDKIETVGKYYASDDDDEISCFCKNVSNMKRLRWLHVIFPFSFPNDGYGEPTFLSNELCYICWHRYPGISFPDSFHPMKLVVLELYQSLQKALWKDYKDLPCLKVLELKEMQNLVSTPDFKRLPCLQKLTLDDCEELEEIHPSLGNHARLKYVSIRSCTKLRMFPTIVQMGKLQTLKFMSCDQMVEFPKIQANMESLVNLSLIETRIEVLPSSIGKRCTNLTLLDLTHCYNLKSIEFNVDALIRLKEFKCHPFRNPRFQLSKIMRFHEFPRSLQKLVLSTYAIEDGKILSSILELSNLEELDLSWNNFCRLDSRLSQLTQLKILNLQGCTNLVGLPELPSSLAVLKAPWCESLTKSLPNCKCLHQVSLSPGSIINHGNRVLEYMLEGKAMENGIMVFTLEGGRELAKGITPGLLRRGNKCRLQLPENWRNKFSGFLMCAVWKSGFFNIKGIGAYIKVKGVKSDDDDEDEVDRKESDDDDDEVDCEDEADWKETDDDGDDDDDEVDWKDSDDDEVEVDGEDEADRKESDDDDDVDWWEESNDDDDDDDDDDEVGCEDDVDWKESDDDEVTWVGYISFLRLRETPWWEHTYNQLSFRIYDASGFGVKLVDKTSESGNGPTHFSQISNYTPGLDIYYPTVHGMEINFHSMMREHIL